MLAFIPNIAGWVFRKAASALAGKSKGKGLRRGTGVGKNNKNDSNKTNRLTDAALVAGKVTADALAKRPGIQASLDSLKMRFTTGKGEVHKPTDYVYENADNIIALLDLKAVDIKRLAVDGVPGSGKSTLAKILAEKLNFKVRTLDYIDLNKPQDFTQNKTIYEHHRLLRTQDIDNFDAIIYIDEPVEFSKQKCLNRKRGGINIDVFDYEKLKEIGAEAFDIAAGKSYKISNSYIEIKIKPKTGFRAYENIRNKLKKKGFETEGLCKEELLFASAYGKAAKGLMAYVRLDAYNKEIMEGLSAGVLRFLMA